MFYIYLDAFSARGAGPYQITVGEGRCDEQGCQDDGGCGAGQICEGGACVAGCRRDLDCPVFEQCVDQVCVPEPECQVDADCFAGDQCVDGACVEAQGCVVDADCPGDTNLCSGGDCVDVGGCAVDGNCPRGEQCVQGACQPRPAGCLGDADCGNQQLCLAGLCRVAQCREDRDCDGGRDCVLNWCTDADFSSCDFPSAVGGSALFEVGLNNNNPDPFRCGDVGGGDMKFAWFPRAGQYCISTEGSDVDTVVSVWSGGCRNGRQLGCDDDAGFLAGGQSALDFRVDGDQGDLWIAVDTRPGSRGAVRLRVSAGACEAPEPCGDRVACYYGRVCVDGACVQCEHDGHCADPRDSCVDGQCTRLPPGTCAEPIDILRSGPLYGITQGRSQGGNDIRCAFGSQQAPDSFLRFEAPAAGDWCFDPTGTSFRPVLMLYREGDCFTAGACRQGPLTWRADRAGDRTLILVDGVRADESGPFTLNVTRGACQ